MKAFVSFMSQLSLVAFLVAVAMNFPSEHAMRVWCLAVAFAQLVDAFVQFAARRTEARIERMKERAWSDLVREAREARLRSMYPTREMRPMGHRVCEKKGGE